jgi:hypothetical protein
MTTSAFQQSDYKSNIDQTDRHLHVTSGSKNIKVEEQSLNGYSMNNTLNCILDELKKMNKHLSLITDIEFKKGD